MVYIVELQDKARHTARKEYWAMSLRDLLRVVAEELITYPHLTVNDVWVKGQGSTGLYGGTL
jgi:hypothetical protein